MSTPTGARLQYLPGLDGLRALAVVGVLFFHAGYGWASGGFLGVSAFFTLSGFLIATIVLREHAATGAVDLKAFWKRRARRLLPALFIAAVLILFFLAAAGSSLQSESVAEDGPWAFPAGLSLPVVDSSNPAATSIPHHSTSRAASSKSLHTE